MARLSWLFLGWTFFFTALAGAGVDEWRTYTSKREIRSLAAIDGVVWGATSGGLFSYAVADSSFIQYTTSEGLRTIDLSAVAVDRSKTVWVGASNGFLHRFDPSANQWSYVTDIFVRSDPTKRINRLEAVGDTLYILSDIGVSVFSISQMEFRDTFTRFGVSPNQIVGATTSLRVFNGRLWVGTHNGLASVSLSGRNPSAPESWTVYTTAQGLPANDILALAIDYDSLFAATRSGLAAFDGNSWYAENSTAGLNILGLTSGAVMETDCPVSCSVYFITASALWKYHPSQGTQTVTSGFSSSLSSMASDSILGTTSRGLLVAQGPAWISRIPPGPTSNKFVGIAVDRNGSVWTATGAANADGFMSFDGARWTSYTSGQDPRLRNDNYFKVSIGRNNSKWISNWGAGVALLDDGGNLLRVLSTFNGLPPSLDFDPNFVVVGGTATDRDGVTWITNRTGQGDTALTKFNPDSSLSYVVGLPMRNPFNVFTDVIIDAYDTKWFANFSRFEPVPPFGFYYYNEHFRVPGSTNGWGRLTTDDGLTSNKVWSEAIDHDGALWVGSDQGISIIFDPSNPQSSIAAYHPLRDQIIQAIAVDPLNSKWIGTKQGVFVLSSDGTSILHSYTAENTQGKLLDNDIASIAINPQTGSIYFGTEKGLSSLTTYAVTPKRNFDGLSVSPDPLYLPSRTPLIVDGLVDNTTLKVLGIDGTLVREIRTPGGRVGYWDGTDERGHLVATGIYLIVAYSEDGGKVAMGKVAVIRR